MSTKTKTTTVAALAALTFPAAALAHDGEKRGHDKDGRAGQAESRSDHKGKHKGHKGKHKGRHHGRRAFIVAGTDVSGLTVTDGKLAGPITLDPIFASAKAFKALDLTREKIAGEDTIQVGTAGDAVEVKYKGLQATDALAPTDVVKIHAKVDRETGAVDIKHVKVWRKAS